MQQDAAAVAGEQAADGGVTAGALLRQAREASGLHVAALAVSLKVPVRKLEALEDDRWDLLPDSVFVRALASSVCRSLKVDPKPILDRLPQNAAPRLVRDGEGINTPFRAPSDGAPTTWFDQLSKPVFLAVFALLLGALVLILLPASQPDTPTTTVATTEASPVPKPVVLPGPAVAPAVTAAPPVVSVAPATLPAPAAVAAASAPVMVSSTSNASTAISPVAVAPAGAASGIVVFRTKGPSWVEVTDAKGVVTMRRQLEAGDAAGASGQPPLQVTIGRVDHTEVQVRGKPFDLRPVSKDNVARFEVK